MNLKSCKTDIWLEFHNQGKSQSGELSELIIQLVLSLFFAPQTFLSTLPLFLLVLLLFHFIQYTTQTERQSQSQITFLCTCGVHWIWIKKKEKWIKNRIKKNIYNIHIIYTYVYTDIYINIRINIRDIKNTSKKEREKDTWSGWEEKCLPTSGNNSK